MHSPLAGLVTTGALEAALEYGAQHRVRNHPQETYQGCNRQQERQAGGKRAASGHEYGSARAVSVRAHQAASAAAAETMAASPSGTAVSRALPPCAAWPGSAPVPC